MVQKSHLISLGARIRELRKKAGLSQEDVADKAGLNPNYIGRVERGEINVTVDTLFKIAVSLNVGVDEFFGQPPYQGARTKLQAEVASVLFELDVETLRALRDLLKTMQRSA
jgi:transcriptional regulator with XRE-family HTH domain